MYFFRCDHGQYPVRFNSSLHSAYKLFTTSFGQPVVIFSDIRGEPKLTRESWASRWAQVMAPALAGY